MESYHYQPIGHIESIFLTRNGTLRQSGLSQYARAKLTINKTFFTNPEHSLENLCEYSHIWIVWVFHQNPSSNNSVKAKVCPPRLGGERVGVFSTRSPHRPANIGLTLARLEKVQGDTIHMSDIDLVDGTPVLDIKPYIPQYDAPTDQHKQHAIEESNEEDVDDSLKGAIKTKVRTPKWVGDPEENLSVIFSSRAEKDIERLDISKMKWLKSKAELRSAICDILSSDPRSVYRKTKCSDRMYFTSLDSVHISAWYDPDIDGMEVLRLKQDT